MEGILKLRDLESLPPEMIVEVLAKLDPESLVEICKASTKMRFLCRDGWRNLFKRDVTRAKVCENSNWEKLYRLAMTGTFPVNEITFGKKKRYIIGTEKKVNPYSKVAKVGEISMRDVMTSNPKSIKTSLYRITYSAADVEEEDISEKWALGKGLVRATREALDDLYVTRRGINKFLRQHGGKIGTFDEEVEVEWEEGVVEADAIEIKVERMAYISKSQFRSFRDKICRMK